MYLLKQLLFLWLRNFTFYHALWHILGSGWHSASYREGKLLGRKFANFAVARVPAEIGWWLGEVQNIPQFLFRINKYDCRSQELEMPGGLKEEDAQRKIGWTDENYWPEVSSFNSHLNEQQGWKSQNTLTKDNNILYGLRGHWALLYGM